MSKLTQDPLAIVKSMVKSQSYVKKYPDIQRLNAFSVSKLAWDWKEQVEWKMGRGKDEYNGHMMVGRIVGQSIADEFVRRDSDWEQEVQVKLTLPFKWKNPKLRHLQDIILLGHIDLLNRRTKQLVELKTSVFKNDIKDYARNQASVYWAILMKVERLDFTTKIIKIAVPPAEEVLPFDMKKVYAQHIFKCAYDCAKELDKIFA